MVDFPYFTQSSAISFFYMMIDTDLSLYSADTPNDILLKSRP